jgi:CRP/FNR family transcriptional regulator
MLLNHSSQTPGQAVESLSQLFQDPDLEAQPVDLRAGATLRHSPTSEFQNIYVIISGQIWTYQLEAADRSRLAEILGPQDWFGAAALADLGEFHWEAVAAVDSHLLQIPGERLLSLLPRHPHASVELIRQLAIKLRTAREDTARLMFDDCNLRLIKTLLRFSTTAAASRHKEGVVLRITHQQLAQAVGAARETISLALTDLRRLDLLRTGRNQLFFNPEALRCFMEHSPQARSSAVAHCA